MGDTYEKSENLCSKLCCTKIENFAVSFGAAKIFDNVNVHIHCGELTAIIGKEDIIDGEIINLGTDEVNTTQEGIQVVETIMNKRLIIDYKPARNGDQLRTSAVIDKAKSLLGYEPKTSLKQGLQNQVDWYLEKFT